MHDVLQVVRNPRMIGLGLLAVLCAVAFVFLSQWQADRSHEETAKSDQFRANVSATPVPFSDLVAPGEPLPPAEEFRAVTATGVYDASAQVLVRNRSQNGPGMIVAAPLRTVDGTWLWVARGWVPAAGSATSEVSQPVPPSGTVTVSGIARPTEHAPAGGIAPPDLPAGQVTAIDVEVLSADLGAPAYSAILQADHETPAPAQAIQMLELPAGIGGGLQQLSYAVQWAIFALIAVFGFGMIVRLEVRERREAATGDAGRGEAATVDGGRGGSAVGEGAVAADMLPRPSGPVEPADSV